MLYSNYFLVFPFPIKGGGIMSNQSNIQETFLLNLIHRLAPDDRKIKEWVDEIRNNNPELSRDELADYIGDHIVWTYTKQGAMLALPGAIPILGTLLQISTEAGVIPIDMALMIRNQTHLVFAIGHCYGIKGREILIQDTLICMGLWTQTLSITKSRTIQVCTKIIDKNFKKRFSAKILQSINKKIGATLLTKYGTKRGAIALGKLIPLGVGVLVSGGFNYMTMKYFKEKSIEYLRGKVRKTRRYTKYNLVVKVSKRL